MKNLKTISKTIEVFREISYIKINDIYCAFKDYQYDSEGKKIILKEGIALMVNVENAKDFEPIAEVGDIKLAFKTILDISKKYPWHKHNRSYLKNQFIPNPYSYLEYCKNEKIDSKATLFKVDNYNLLDLEGNLYKKGLIVDFDGKRFDLNKIQSILKSNNELITISKQLDKKLSPTFISCVYVPDERVFELYKSNFNKIKSRSEESEFVLKNALTLPEEVFKIA